MIPGQFSTVGRPGSCPPVQQRQTAAQEEGSVTELGLSTTRRIRAPRGGGMSSLMASLTSPTPGRSGPVHRSNSSLDSEASCNSVSFRLLSASSSCSQVSLTFSGEESVFWVILFPLFCLFLVTGCSGFSQ